jgi:hypothetical protein
MRTASVTMIGQFPDGIDMHARNLRWALSEQDHIYIVTTGSFIKNYNLQNDQRVTYIDFGERDNIQTFLPYWEEFPRIVRERGIDPEWFLFMEQDIWFHEKIKDDPPPDPKEIRGHLPLDTAYHAVLLDNELLVHPRIWEGSVLLHGPLVQRALLYGIDFGQHNNLFISKDKPYWDKLAGGTVRFGLYDHCDTMDELTLYCALVEKTTMTHCPRAVHLRGAEAIHRYQPELYQWIEEERLCSIADLWKPWNYCLYAAVALYFIAGNWKQGADWKRMQRRYQWQFKKLVPTAREWMKPEEYERLERIVAAL